MASWYNQRFRKETNLEQCNLQVPLTGLQWNRPLHDMWAWEGQGYVHPELVCRFPSNRWKINDIWSQVRAQRPKPKAQENNNRLINPVVALSVFSAQATRACKGPKVACGECPKPQTETSTLRSTKLTKPRDTHLNSRPSGPRVKPSQHAQVKSVAGCACKELELGNLSPRYGSGFRVWGVGHRSWGPGNDYRHPFVCWLRG